MSGVPTLEPANVGRLIVAVAVVIVVSLVAMAVSRDRVIRPDLSAVPLPEGSVTHAAVEDCTGDDPPVCTVHLAVGPAGGVELPRDTEVMLVEHLRAEGWRPSGDGGAVAGLTSPDGDLIARVSGYVPDEVPEALESGVDEDVDRGDLAEVLVIPLEAR